MSWLSEAGKEMLQRHLLAGSFEWRLPQGVDCALTFDDGPHPEYTPRVLDLLATQQIKATFFVIGKTARQSPELLRRIVQEGHSVGSHTYSHRDFPSLNRADLWQELTSCRELLRDLTGVDTSLVRPPRGRVNVQALVRIKRWGYRLIHWSKTYSDYLRDGREPLLQRIRTIGLDPGDIALFHDNNPHTIEALAVMLPEWRQREHRFVLLR